MSEELDDDEEFEQEDDFDDDELDGEPSPFCAEPNHPPSDTRCIHNVAWTWDGQIEALGGATQLAEAWAALRNRVYEVEADSPEDAQLHARALTVPLGARLVQLARQDVGLADVLQQLAGATASGGWSTNGMLGGSGDCWYVRDPAQVAGIAAQCIGLCRMDQAA